MLSATLVLAVVAPNVTLPPSRIDEVQRGLPEIVEASAASLRPTKWLDALAAPSPGAPRKLALVWVHEVGVTVADLPERGEDAGAGWVPMRNWLTVGLARPGDDERVVRTR